MRRAGVTFVPDDSFDVVTGAFGFTGRYIARRVLAIGRRVRTLTNHPNRPNPFGAEVETAPYLFDDPDALADALRGARTLYNTYWVRFEHGPFTFDKAVRNGAVLFDAARRAGVRRIVHVSVANASLDSPFPYFRGKARLENALRETGVSHAIIRPTWTFGREDILVNNIAYLLRRVPFFAMPGSGEYRVTPVFVADVADMAMELGIRDDDVTIDAAGPETYTFDELVRKIARAIHVKARIVHVPPVLTVLIGKLMGPIVGDVILTRDEARALIAGLLTSAEPPTGETSFDDWLERNTAELGMSYVSELKRHFR